MKYLDLLTGYFPLAVLCAICCQGKVEVEFNCKFAQNTAHILVSYSTMGLGYSFRVKVGSWCTQGFACFSGSGWVTDSPNQTIEWERGAP